jgi:DNA-directed RNA polymerase-3 subunit RPC5
MAETEMENDPDPITHSYDVFVKPHISSDRQIYVLQFPNRDSKQHYSQAHGALPLKMRVKPNAGMVEMDVPMDAWNNYDVSKGIKWGEAVKKSTANKGAGSHGLPGGFGIGGAQARTRGSRSVEDSTVSQEEIMRDYEKAIKQEQVLVKQTLGGQAVPITETTPQYMVGTFRGGML